MRSELTMLLTTSYGLGISFVCNISSARDDGSWDGVGEQLQFSEFGNGGGNGIAEYVKGIISEVN